MNKNAAQTAALNYVLARSRYSRRATAPHAAELRRAADAAEKAGLELLALDTFDVPADVLTEAAIIIRGERQSCGCAACARTATAAGGAL